MTEAMREYIKGDLGPVMGRIQREQDHYNALAESGMDRGTGDVTSALLVLIWAPLTRLHLEMNDPQALKQARQALGLDRKLPTE